MPSLSLLSFSPVRFILLASLQGAVAAEVDGVESCMWCSQAGADAVCSTTCRSEPAGDEERLLCSFRVGHSCTETFPDVLIFCVCQKLQMDRKREVSRCAMYGLTHAGPKEGMIVKTERSKSTKLAWKIAWL